MKIAITGGNNGLGASLARVWEAHDNQVTVLSRSSGHDINNARLWLDEILDHDIMINNAYSGHAQTDLLFELFARWQGQQKYIINISSEMTTRMLQPRVDDSVAVPYPWPQGQRDVIYRTAKRTLEDAQNFLGQQHDWPRMQLIRPAMLNTQRIGFVPMDLDSRNSMDTDILADWLYSVWENREHFWVSEITVRPLHWYS